MHTGRQLLLSSSANTCQERGRVFERLTQHATHRHSDVYGPARFKNVWRWVDGHGRIGRRTDTAVMQESTSFFRIDQGGFGAMRNVYPVMPIVQTMVGPAWLPSWGGGTQSRLSLWRSTTRAARLLTLRSRTALARRWVADS